MNILNVTLGFVPAYAWGGPVRTIYQNSQELLHRSHAISVCATNLLDKSSKIGSGSFERDVDGIRSVYLSTYVIRQWPGTLGPTMLSAAAFWRLWREMRSADVVHVHGVRNIVSIAGAYFALVNGKPLVVQPHGTLQHIVSSVGLKRQQDKWLTRALVKNAERLVACTDREIEQISSAGGSRQNTVVIPVGRDTGGVDPEHVRGKFRTAFEIAKNDRIVLFLARINRKKGTDLLVEAWARVDPETRRHVKLVIAGPDDGQLAEVQGLVDKYGLEDEVMFTGLLTGDMVQAAMGDAHVFVLPCRTDTFPRTLVEACEAGTPIVVTETCEIAHLLADKAATVVQVSIDALGEAIATLLGDSVLWDQRHKAARKLAQEAFSMKAVGDALEEVYHSALLAKQ